MRKHIGLWLCISAVPVFGQGKGVDRWQECDAGLKEILGRPDGAMVRGLPDRAECVVIVPSVRKAAFVVGASYGRPVLRRRKGQNFDGPSCAPAMYALEGTLRADGGANRNLFGQNLSARDVVREGKVKIPEAGKQLVQLPETTSPRHAP
jgi:lipid-binding SYLF domain-containing protein